MMWFLERIKEFAVGAVIVASWVLSMNIVEYLIGSNLTVGAGYLSQASPIILTALWIVIGTMTVWIGHNFLQKSLGKAMVSWLETAVILAILIISNSFLVWFLALLLVMIVQANSSDDMDNRCRRV